MFYDDVLTLEEKIQSSQLTPMGYVPVGDYRISGKGSVEVRNEDAEGLCKMASRRIKAAVWNGIVQSGVFITSVEDSMVDVWTAYLSPKYKNERKVARKRVEKKLLDKGVDPLKAKALSKSASIPNKEKYSAAVKTGLVTLNIGGVWEDDFRNLMDAIGGNWDHALRMNVAVKFLYTAPSVGQAASLFYAVETGLKSVGVDADGLTTLMTSAYFNARMFENFVAMYKLSKNEYAGSPTSALTLTGAVIGSMLKIPEIKKYFRRGSSTKVI